MTDWIYNETKLCGVDYADAAQAENYDGQHGKFRNYEKEFLDLLDYLSLDSTADKTLVDLGCGTGALALYACGSFKKVYAVDVSDAMIKLARGKAEEKNIGNIEFITSGFLTYSHKSGPVDVVLTKAAFHHLPDFWKQVALLRINSMLKKGGYFYLHDVVFHFRPVEYASRIEAWISGFEKAAGKQFRAEVETHIRDEFSTFSWIIEGMLARAGFEIIKSGSPDGFISEYLCRKIEDAVF